MKYLLLIYHNSESRRLWETFSDEQRAEGLQAYAALNESLAASGELIVTEALADPSEAKTVRVTEDRTESSDGPFAETMDRAVEIAASIPEASLGLIEVRPILTYSGLEM